MRLALAAVAADGKAIPTHPVSIRGKQYLAVVAALPEVGWYDLSLLDLEVLMPRSDYQDLFLIVCITVFGILLMLFFALQRLVVRPVARLMSAAVGLSGGEFPSLMKGSANDEVGRLTEQFNAMNESLRLTQNWLEHKVDGRTSEVDDAKRMLEILLQQEKDGREAQANLLALVAHEVRNPVAVIGNTAQMLGVLACREKPEWLPRIENIMVAVRKLAGLMDEILSEQRTGSGSSGLELQGLAVHDMCAELAGNLSSGYGREIGYEGGCGELCIEADRRLLEIAIGNLIDNAVKYAPAESGISLRVNGGTHLCIEVCDRGKPVSPELRACLFKKLASRNRAEGKQGLGIGLYLVNWIAHLHGGHAEYDNTEAGNAFRLVLPLR